MTGFRAETGFITCNCERMGSANCLSHVTYKSVGMTGFRGKTDFILHNSVRDWAQLTDSMLHTRGAVRLHFPCRLTLTHILEHFVQSGTVGLA